MKWTSKTKYKQLGHKSGIVKKVIKRFNHSNELNSMIVREKLITIVHLVKKAGNFAHIYTFICLIR